MTGFPGHQLLSIDERQRHQRRVTWNLEFKAVLKVGSKPKTGVLFDIIRPSNKQAEYLCKATQVRIVAFAVVAPTEQGQAAHRSNVEFMQKTIEKSKE